MAHEWMMLREPEDFSALTDLAPDECVNGLGPDRLVSSTYEQTVAPFARPAGS